MEAILKISEAVTNIIKKAEPIRENAIKITLAE
jgi:hypothetical protein